MTEVKFLRGDSHTVRVYEEGKDVGGFSGPVDIIDGIMKMQSEYERLAESEKRPHAVGDLTMKRIFEANGMVNMYDLQRVLDAVEVELAKLLKLATNAEHYGAENGFGLGVQRVKEKMSAAYRANIGRIWLTEAELLKIIDSVTWTDRDGRPLSNSEYVELASKRDVAFNRGVFNAGVQAAADRVDDVWRHRRGVINCTELCAEIRSLLKTGDDVPEFVKVVPVPAAIKEQAEKEELLVNLFPYADNTPPTLDWHYVECKTNPNGKSICGWFPTRELAYMHRDFWPQHIKDFTFVKPMLIVDPGMALHFPEQAGSDVLRKTNDYLVTCGVAKVGLGERYFPEPLNDLGNNALMQKEMDALCEAHDNALDAPWLNEPVSQDKATQDQVAAIMLAKGDNGQVAEVVAHFRGAPALKTNQEWRAADPEVLKLRAEIGAMAKLLHGMPPQNGSLVARLEALVERAAQLEMESRASKLNVSKWMYEIGDRVFKPKGAWWEGKVVGFYSTVQTPRGYAVQLQTRDDNGPVQIYPESALELRS